MAAQRQMFPQHHGLTDACNEARPKRVEKAAVVEGYNGPVYCEEVMGPNDNYCRDMEELLDYLADDFEGDERPAWAFCCDIVLCEIDSHQVLEHATQDLHEDAYDQLPDQAVKDLEAACKAFNEAVKASGFKSWMVDYSRKVPIPVRQQKGAETR